MCREVEGGVLKIINWIQSHLLLIGMAYILAETVYYITRRVRYEETREEDADRKFDSTGDICRTASKTARRNDET